jgi:hypothetical protein
MSEDPVGYKDGYNLYQYARNNPLKYYDPMGTTSRYYGSVRSNSCSSGDCVNSTSYWSGAVTSSVNRADANRRARTALIIGATIISGGRGGRYLIGPRSPLFGHGFARASGRSGYFNRRHTRLGYSRYGGKGKSRYHFELRVGDHNTSNSWWSIGVKDADKW